MKINRYDLHILIQTSLESLRLADGGQIFTFTTEARKDAASRVLGLLSGEEEEVDGSDQKEE